MTLATNWVDNIGMFVNAAYLNQNGSETNANTAARPDGGTFAARPAAAASNAGAFYFCTDNGVLYKSTGSAWVKHRIGGDACDAMGDVPTTGWTPVGMPAGGSWSADKDAMVLTMPVQASWAYQYRAYPTPPFTLTAYLDVMSGTILGGSQAVCTGIVVSDGTKLITLGPAWNNTTGAPWGDGRGIYGGAAKWSSVGASPAAMQSNFAALSQLGKLPHWYRIVDDGTNRSVQWSINGIDWYTYQSEPRNTFLTATRIGIGAWNAGNETALLRVRSWNGVA